MWIGAVALAGCAVALLAWWARRERAVSRSEAAHPASRRAAEEAHRMGLEHARAGRALAATPYFRRVVEQAPGSWFAHENLAGALGNSAQEARTHLGKEEIGTRSSVERIALLSECIRETEAAERLTSSPDDRATVLFERARALQTWGFPCDALARFRAAAALAPRRAVILEALRRAEQDLRNLEG